MRRTLLRRALQLAVLIAACGAARNAYALPSNVSVTPPDGARFAVGQRFDLRVEGKGAGPFSATLSIDGARQTFTSGAQNTTTTDGITVAGFGGFNLRGYSNQTPGFHTITATFSDATGSVTVAAQFEIVDVRGQLAPAKNIIIMLGDGMGAAHRTAARLVRYGVTNGRPNDFLAMEKFPGTGMVTTHSLNTVVTDSAPGMACYTTGNHSNNNQEGVYPANVTNPFFAPRVEYMSEYLRRTLGKVTGIVTTADVEDATPAANAVHTANRNAGTGICDQYLDESSNTGLTVLMGGGRRWFLPAGQFGSSRSASTDYPALPADLVAAWDIQTTSAQDPARNLLQDFTNAGFTYVDTLTALRSAGASPTKLLGLFSFGNMNVALDKIAKRRGTPLPGQTSFAVDDYRAPDQPMLNEMTDAALNVLSKNRNGFFLMVEGAHIDKQSHAMDADRVIGETIEFDEAVAAARRFADRAGDTVIIVTADHECSGFSLIGALSGGVNNLRSLAPDNATTDPNTQPNRQKLVGTYDAAGFPNYTILSDGYPSTFDIDGKLLVGFGANGDRYENWLTKPLPIVDSLLPDDIKTELRGKGYPNQPYLRAERNEGFFIRGQAAGQDQAVHTATDIPIAAYSSGSRAFTAFYGVQENTDVFFKLLGAAFGGYDRFTRGSGGATVNPVPTITSVSPANISTGSGAFTLTVNGSGFINGSVIRINGSDRTTTFVSDTQLSATVNAADIGASGSNISVAVFNPTPGGGVSNTVNISVSSSPMTVQFSAASYTANEADGAVVLNVTRTGDTSTASNVQYATSNGTASDRTRYEAAFGTLRFAPGETSKTITVLLIDNALVEGDQTFNVTLSNAIGSGLGAPATATVTIRDNDTSPSATNPIDSAQFFVRQQYLDLLNRQPDAAGLTFWTNQLNALLAPCNSLTNQTAKQQCITSARAQVSASFFLSQEFQMTGFFVTRFYAASFGRLPNVREFLTDAQDVGRGVVFGQAGADQLLEQNKTAYAASFTQRTDFKSRFDSLSNADYVNALFDNAGAASGDELALRQSLVSGLNAGTETRASVLRKVIESSAVFNQQFNPSLVFLSYVGYLRRAPDAGGYNFWLAQLNNATGLNEDATNPNAALSRLRRAQLIEAFINSTEYRGRFGY